MGKSLGASFIVESELIAGSSFKRIPMTLKNSATNFEYINNAVASTTGHRPCS